MAIVYADDKLVKGQEVLDLYEDAGWSLLRSRDPDEILRSIRGTSVFVTAREGAKLVGFISAISDGSYYAHVVEFIVRSKLQGRGIDSELVKRLLAALEKETVVSIFAEPDAEKFYKEFGFAATAGGMLLRRIE